MRTQPHQVMLASLCLWACGLGACPADGPSQVEGPFRLKPDFAPLIEPGSPYSFAYQGLGGERPYGNWRLERGSLPPGLSLAAASGELSGSTPASGFWYYVLCADDALGASACELYGVRAATAGSAGPLAMRAQAYQQIYEARHYTHGLSFNCISPDDPAGELGYSTLGDAAFQSGQCTQAMALRYAVEKTPEALAHIKDHLAGWRFFQRLTGVPGLIGRSYAHRDWPMEPGTYEDPDADPDIHRGQGAFAEYLWKGDTSRDQVSGAVNGVALAFDLVDDEEARGLARDFLVELADHVWDHDLNIVDPDGQVTTHGAMDGETLEGLPVPNGMNAVCVLAWLKAAHHASGEQRFADRYRELIEERDYVTILRDYMWVYMGYSTKWYNVYLVYQNWFHLMRLEEDPALREEFKSIFRDTLWLNVDDDSTPNRRAIAEANPVKTAWYLYSTGERDPQRLYEALWQVVVFPAPPLRDRRVTNSDNPDIEPNPAQPSEALAPLPSNLRKPDMVIWHRNPFELDGGVDSGEERTGCDYLLPYWLGRYYGFIGEEW